MVSTSFIRHISDKYNVDSIRTAPMSGQFFQKKSLKGGSLGGLKIPLILGRPPKDPPAFLRPWLCLVGLYIILIAYGHSACPKDPF